MRRLVPVFVAAVLVCASTAAAGSGVPKLVFPVVGAVDYTDDFGQLRAGGPHQGNDLLADKRAPAVAVESGSIEYWTTSASAGCMLYHKGKCVEGVSYAVPDGAHVAAGQTIGYVGDSGDANGIHPHLHFEVHPHDGDAVDPFPFLKKAPHLLLAVPSTDTTFTLKLTGTVVSSDALQLKMTVASLAAWPSHLKEFKLNRVLQLTLPTSDAGASTFTPGEKIVAWTMPSFCTLDALMGEPGALALDRALAR
jgi:hypothetical protein